ncbi:MAG TPA: aminoglycoside phosphotransferase, partial [Rikenellaceae bacterium]|nr:aminoglycoside phosphotransferase [Rikenellaceae bacterium]
MNYVPKSVVEMVAVGLLPHPVLEIEELSSGLINNSWKVVTKDPKHPNYLLQKINHNVFRDVESLQYNIKMVTDYIRNKIILKGIQDIEKHVLTPVPIGVGDNSKFYYWDS